MSRYITLRCPKCRRKKRAGFHVTDPKGTSAVEVVCDRCDNGDFAEVKYFDADGKQIMPDSAAAQSQTWTSEQVQAVHGEAASLIGEFQQKPQAQGEKQ